jgi:hypothetical protein
MKDWKRPFLSTSHPGIFRCFQWNDVHGAVSPVEPASDLRERSPQVDRLIRTVIMKSPDSTNRPVNGIIHIPALRKFNAGMCFFSLVSGLEVAWRIENDGLMPGKKHPLGLLVPLQLFHQKQRGTHSGFLIHAVV